MLNLSPTALLLVRNSLLATKNGVDGLADNLGTGFRGQHHQPTLVELLVYLLAGATAIALTWLAVRLYVRAQQRYQKQPRWLFQRLCRAHRLRWAERRLLWQVALEQYPENPIQLFLEPEGLKPPYAKFHRQSEMDVLAAIAARLFSDYNSDAAAAVARAAAAGPNPLMPLAARAGIDVSNLLIASSTFNESTAAS
jgi:hypothetical protein